MIVKTVSCQNCQKEKPRKSLTHKAFRSGAEGIRTLDLCIANAALSQLSYGPGMGKLYGIISRFESPSAGNFERIGRPGAYSLTVI
jgi:hypothetical protein